MLEAITGEPTMDMLSLPRPEEALSRLRRILVPVDGSAFSEHALRWAVELAHRADAAIDLAFVNVLPPSVVLGDVGLAGQWERNAISHAHEYLDGLASRIHEHDDVSLEKLVVRDTSAARALVRLARARDIGLTVMATHGRSGAARVWLGSVAEAFVRESPAPVLLLHPHGEHETTLRADRLFSRVLVALDGSRNGDAALAEAALIAGLGGGRIDLLHVVDSLSLAAGAHQVETLHLQSLEQERRQGFAYLEQRARQLRATGFEADTAVVIDAMPARAVIDHAKRVDADLVVVGTRGRKGFSRALMGSVAEAVVRGATQPVLVVPSAVNYNGI